MVPPPFRLSSTLAGHGADVRSIATKPNGPTLFSSSRDGTARSWYRAPGSEAGGGGWTDGVVFQGQHEGFVNAVEWITGDGQGYVATAGQDSLIHIWPLPPDLSPSSASPPTPTHTLIGHTSNVCSLNASKDGSLLVSGSWDKTAKVWSTSTWQLLYTLEGHEQAVWAVLALEGGLILTGAADNLIKLWKDGKVKTTFKGHSQAVRALAKLDAGVGDGTLFASAGNDASIRLWSLTTGQSVHVLNGHDSFVYSLAPISDANGGGLISGGEDRTLRVWRAADGECEQTIVIPAVSVWTVAALSNGDVVAGSSDGLVRVFTRTDERVADVETLAAYDKEVSATTLNPSQVGDVKKNDLPGSEALATDGRKEGEVKMINNGGTVEAYQWTSGAWAKIGEVVDAVGNSRKQLYMGEEYDFVFDVDFSDGAQPLKMPYNVTQNPYDVAQRFLLRNELPIEYLDDVVKHIENNTGGVALGTAGSEHVDPYTGASRYRSTGATAPSTSTAGYAGDPYTGGGRSATYSESIPRLLPHKTYLSFTQASLPALRTKLGQLNDQISADSATSSLALTADDLKALDSLISLLLIGTTSLGKTPPKVGEAESAVALKILQWPSALIFPGLDLIRLISLFSPLPESLPSLLEVIQNTSVGPKEQETNTMLAFRSLANAFSCQAGASLLKDETAEIVESLQRRGVKGVNKNGKIALATVALNYSVLAVQKALSPAAAPLFEVIAELLRDSDPEAVYRSLVALGNLLLSPLASEVPAAEKQRFKILAKEAATRLPEARIKAVVAELA